MKPANLLALRLRALSRANAAAFVAITQNIVGNFYLASKARELSTRRRLEASFFGTLDNSHLHS